MRRIRAAWNEHGDGPSRVDPFLAGSRPWEGSRGGAEAAERPLTQRGTPRENAKPPMGKEFRNRKGEHWPEPGMVAAKPVVPFLSRLCGFA